MNKFTTWENEGLITTSRHGWIQVLQHSSTNTSQFRQEGYFWLTSSLLDFSHTVCLAWEKGDLLAGLSAAASKGLTFYWQIAFLEHIDSLNRGQQPNNLLKAIVCFLGLAKHLVHVIQPSKTTLQSYFFQEKLPHISQILMNFWFLMATIVWKVHWTLKYALP